MLSTQNYNVHQTPESMSLSIDSISLHGPVPREFVGAKLVITPNTNFSTSFLSLHPTPEPDLLIPDELPNDPYPAAMGRQIAIEFLCDVMEHGKTSPRYGREVMMLVMKTYIICEDVQWAIIRKCFRYWSQARGISCARRLFLEYVMFGDEMSRARVQRSCEERAHDEVCQRTRSNILDKHVVKSDLDNNVKCVQLGKREFVNHHWTQGIEENLESAKESFTKDRVKKNRFQSGG